MEGDKLPITNGSAISNEDETGLPLLNGIITPSIHNHESKNHQLNGIRSSNSNIDESQSYKVDLDSTCEKSFIKDINNMPTAPSGTGLPTAPDGGFRACLVMVASFLCNGIIFGTINSGGVIFVTLRENLESEGLENPASLASITLSLAIGTTFFLSIVAGVLTDKLGIRLTTVIGGAVGTLGLFLSSVYYKQANVLIVTMGILFGTGSSLAYTPSLVILGHYFQKRLGIVNGFVTAGSSVFTIIITEVLKKIIEARSLRTAFQFLSALMSVVVLCGFIFKPILPNFPANEKCVLEKKNDKSFRSKCRDFFGLFINFQIWKNKRYVVWTIAIPSALFGYFVPYVHLVAYAKNVLGEDVNSQVLVQCIGLTSGLGRIFFGIIADKAWVNRIMLQQISFFCIGTLTMLLTIAGKFWVFIVIALVMGLFDGCFISLLGPIAFDIVGPSGASQAIGCLLAFCSIPLTLGPFIAGVMYDNLGSYLIPFLCAGIPPIVGGFALFLIRCIKPSAEDLGNEIEDMDVKKGLINQSSSSEAKSLLTTTSCSVNKSASSNNDAVLQVDVKQLVHLQRESSV